VALFSVIAAVPTVLVAIFASLLFQSGLEFWFSDRARGMLENTVQIARATYDAEVERVGLETVTMSGDLATYLRSMAIDDPQFREGFPRQVYYRNLSEAIIFTYGADNVVRSFALVSPYDRPTRSPLSRARTAMQSTPRTVSAP
jgi:two-component system nitrogen regulation sensor histidine kinase NtrY